LLITLYLFTTVNLDGIIFIFILKNADQVRGYYLVVKIAVFLLRQGACSWEWWPPEPSPEEWALLGLTDSPWDSAHGNGNHTDQG
jgi:hypothetical protein